MDKFIPNVRTHYAMHGSSVLTYHLGSLFRRRVTPVSPEKRAAYLKLHKDLSQTLALIDRTDPDLLVLNECLYGIWDTEIEEALKARGFKTLAWGLGGHYPGASISALIATKKEGVQIPASMPQGPTIGTGAGIAKIRLRDEKLTLIGVHLSLKMPAHWKNQVRAIAEAVLEEKQVGNDVIIAGDWNDDEKHIFAHETFRSLSLIPAVSPEIPTCPVFLPTHIRPLDHIFIPPTMRTLSSKAIPFGSDHLALFAEVSALT
jgi:endonuclease/exonuclease/phosphatase family metal-dependent hydrolase